MYAVIMISSYVFKESSHVSGQCSVGIVRGVARPRPFKKALIIKKIIARKRLKFFA